MGMQPPVIDWAVLRLHERGIYDGLLRDNSQEGAACVCRVGSPCRQVLVGMVSGLQAVPRQLLKHVPRPTAHGLRGSDDWLMSWRGCLVAVHWHTAVDCRCAAGRGGSRGCRWSAALMVGRRRSQASRLGPFLRQSFLAALLPWQHHPAGSSSSACMLDAGPAACRLTDIALYARMKACHSRPCVLHTSDARLWLGWWLVAPPENSRPDVWRNKTRRRTSEWKPGSLVCRYCWALFWAITTLATVGYGDPVSQNLAGVRPRLCASAASMCLALRTLSHTLWAASCPP